MSILIKNGRIIDGLNNPSYKSDLLIENSVISDISTSKIGVKTDNVIDAMNKIICPGFIDVHSHFDFSYFADKFAIRSVVQGITTEIVGNCGLGLAPMNEIVDTYYSKYIKFVLGSLEIRPFQRISDFMTHIEENGCSLNVGFHVPQGNVRAHVMGLADRKADDEELEEMKKLVKQGMEDGAYGLSTGLIYPPGSITTTEEIIELCRVVQEFDGIYSTHMRDEGKGVLNSIKEAIRIGKESGVSVQISHVKAAGAFTGKTVKKMLELFEQAKSEGMNINGDIYPYTAGNSVLSALLQPWVFEDGNFQKNVSNPDTRQRIIDEFKDYVWDLVGIPKILRFIPKSVWLKLLMYLVTKRVLITSMMHR
ncbi:MAG: N-acyl-D-amino-acid deacylase family protein, partial [Candidatus Helarchaeota archaeon]